MTSWIPRPAPWAACLRLSPFVSFHVGVSACLPFQAVSLHADNLVRLPVSFLRLSPLSPLVSLFVCRWPRSGPWGLRCLPLSPFMWVGRGFWAACACSSIHPASVDVGPTSTPPSIKGPTSTLEGGRWPNIHPSSVDVAPRPQINPSSVVQHAPLKRGRWPNIQHPPLKSGCWPKPFKRGPTSTPQAWMLAQHPPLNKHGSSTTQGWMLQNVDVCPTPTRQACQHPPLKRGYYPSSADVGPTSDHGPTSTLQAWTLAQHPPLKRGRS